MPADDAELIELSRNDTPPTSSRAGQLRPSARAIPIAIETEVWPIISEDVPFNL